jgi:hypothetical protein
MKQAAPGNGITLPPLLPPPTGGKTGKNSTFFIRFFACSHVSGSK